MIEKLEAIKQRWLELGEQLATPEVVNDHRKAAKISKKYKDLQVIVDAYEPYRGVMANIDENREILKTDPDPDFRDMAKAELEELLVQQTEMEEHLRNLLIPEDPEDSKSAILEIRAGTGGDEAAIFAGDLFRMYSRYCDRRGWKMIALSINESSAGGYKELILEVTGEGAYGDLKYESGVHRVQRVPDTESQGRVHTSAATVAVLPEADDDVAIEINETDLKIDTFRASGAGGQHVKQNRVGNTHYPHAIGYCGRLPNGALANAKPRGSYANAAYQTIRSRSAKTTRYYRKPPPYPCINRRPLGKNTYLQLSTR